MLWRVSRPIRSRSKPPGFILPCQPALAERPPSGPGWLHEIKFDGYRVIARKDGDRVRLWARTRSDYSKAFIRIRDAVAGLPIDCLVLDGEAVLLRSDNTFLGCVFPHRFFLIARLAIQQPDGTGMLEETMTSRLSSVWPLLSTSSLHFVAWTCGAGSFAGPFGDSMPSRVIINGTALRDDPQLTD